MSYLKKLVNDAIIDIKKTSDTVSLNNIRIKYLGKGGYLKNQISILNKLPLKERSTIGAAINEAKYQIQQAIDTHKANLKKKLLNSSLIKRNIDISMPGRRTNNGSAHPITQTISCIENFFYKLNFKVINGTEIEDVYHNFYALNITDDHPACTKEDTFWFDSLRLLRTHTSGLQIRTMKDKKPPISIISSGRVYRKDYDQTHTPMFHQTEGLVINKKINFTDLKNLLFNFLKYFFQSRLKIRFRPSYFPFTKLSAEVDMLDENGRWLEILGCGMVHPKILYNVNINPEVYSGLAFGIGIERLAMLKYGINDIRMFFENDLRFLKQFS